MSGSASKGNRCMLYSPATISTATSINTAARFFSAASTSLVIMACARGSAFVGNGALHERSLQPVAAIGDDGRAGRQATENLCHAVGGIAGANGAPRETAVAGRDEYDRLSIHILERRVRYKRRVPTERRLDLDRAEHICAECAVAVRQLAADRYCAGVGVDLVGDIDDAAGELSIAIPIEVD